MYVLVGNDHAIEGYRDPQSDDPELVRYRGVEGQRVTTLEFPEGLTTMEAFDATVRSLAHHIHREHAPAWFESDSDTLKALLAEHYALPDSKAKAPRSWGKDTGAAEVIKTVSAPADCKDA
jgi:hypothetical protein